MVGERSRWWVPRSIDRRVARAIVSGLLEFLAELQVPGHPARKRFDDAVADLIDRLEHSPEMRDAVQRAKEQLLANPVVQDYLGAIWDEARRLILRDATIPESRMR